MDLQTLSKPKRAYLFVYLFVFTCTVLEITILNIVMTSLKKKSYDFWN